MNSKLARARSSRRCLGPTSRVAEDTDQRANLTWAFGFDFFGQDGCRRVATDFGQSAHADFQRP